MSDQYGVHIEGGKLPLTKATAESIEAISSAYARIAEAFARAISGISPAPHDMVISDCVFQVGSQPAEPREKEDE